MIKFLLNRPAATAVAAIAMNSCLIVPSEVAAQGKSETALRTEVTQYLLSFQKGTGLPANELNPSIQFVDLNSDSIFEALVVIGDPGWCGSHGCSAFVLDLRGSVAKSIGDFTAFKLQPLSSRTRGWRDISVDGNRVHFDGRVYGFGTGSLAQDSATQKMKFEPIPSTTSSRGTHDVANSLDVQVMERPWPGALGNCGLANVWSLKASGDGFLAVRSGPGPQFRKIAELHNLDRVLIYEQRGQWLGIAYGDLPKSECVSKVARPAQAVSTGWVAEKWIERD